MVENAHIVSGEKIAQYEKGINPPIEMVENINRFNELNYPDQTVMKTKSGQAFMVKGDFRNGNITVVKGVDYNNADKTISTELKRLSSVMNEQDIVYKDIYRILKNRNVDQTMKNAEVMFNDANGKIFTRRNDDEIKSKGNQRATMGDFLNNWKESVVTLNNELSTSFKTLAEKYPERATAFANDCSVMIQDMCNNPILGDYVAQNLTFKKEIEEFQKSHADSKEMGAFYASQVDMQKSVDNAKASVLESVQKEGNLSSDAMFKRYLANSVGNTNLSKDELKAVRKNFDRAVMSLVKDKQLEPNAEITKFSFKHSTKPLKPMTVAVSQEKDKER